MGNSLRQQKNTILLALIVGILLMTAKFLAYLITDSNAIFTDALESIVNVVAGGFAFYSIYLSARPKDLNHPYGHGKVEYFSAFLEGTLIAIAGIIILIKAVYGYFYPTPITKLVGGIWIVSGTGIINYILGRYLVRQGKRFDSMTLLADGKHLLSDAYSTLGLVLGLLILYITGQHWIDTLLSVGLGIYIAYNGYKLIRRSVGGLMDESDEEAVREVVKILENNRRDAWIDIHNLRVQRYGAEMHIDCHLTLPNYFDLHRVHDEVSDVDKLVNAHIRIPTELFIHADPCIPQCCPYCKVKDCPIRSAEKKAEIPWDLDLVRNNQKHYRSVYNKKQHS